MKFNKINKTKKYVFLRLCGGIGNQLFMFSAALAHAKINNAELIVDDFSGYIIDKYKRKPKISSCGFKYRSTFKLLFFPVIFQFSRNILRINIIKIFFSCHFIRQDKIKKNLDLRILTKHNYSYTYIDGYWQSEKYFKSSKYDILSTFYNSQIFKKKIQLNSSDRDRFVLIHYRSFKEVSGQDSIINFNFYFKAIKRIQESIVNPIYFLLSDDMTIAIDIFNKNNINVIPLYQSTDLNDFTLISSFKNIIISNSTFCWWAAYFSDNYYDNSGILIACKYNIKTMYTSWGFEDLLMDNWIQIE